MSFILVFLTLSWTLTELLTDAPYLTECRSTVSEQQTWQSLQMQYRITEWKKNYDKIVILYVNNFVDLFYIVCLITLNCSCFDEWFRVARICIRFSKVKVIKTKNSGNCRQPWQLSWYIFEEGIIV